MSDDLDRALDRMTLPQRIALAKVLAAAMALDSAKKRAEAKPGEVAWSGPVDVLKD